MGIEIERKYLVEKEKFKNREKGFYIKQGYLSRNEDKTVRVRLYKDKGFITIKGKTKNFSRTEYEYEIPYEDGNKMLDSLCQKHIIEKIRYEYLFEGHLWVIDEFNGENEGLLIAEIELISESETFIKPDFIGEEITNDYRYANSTLSKKPYTCW